MKSGIIPNANQLFAERFKSARLMNGLSLQDLADQLDNRISRQALHKYEKGEVLPDSEMLAVLCSVLNVKPDYFFRETQIQLGELEFRSMKNFSAKEQNRIEGFTRDVLERYIELEEIIGIETRFENPLKDFTIIESLAHIELAATSVRESWSLGTSPIANSIELLEDHHIKIIEINSEDTFDGLQTWVNGNIPVIAINRSQIKSADRIRFTILHELGHLLLPLSGLPKAQKEKFCHQFAAAMLLPREVIQKEVGLSRKKLFVQELGALKQQYGISIQAIAYRLNDLGIITNKYLKQFMMVMNVNNWQQNEPVQYEGIEKSNRFKQLIFRALAEENISINKAAALSNQSLIEFRKQVQLFE